MTNDDDDDDCTVLAYSQSARPTLSCHPTTVISVYFSQTLVILFILTKPSQLSVFVRSLPIPIVFAIAGQRCVRCSKFDRLGCSALSVVIVSAVLGVSPPGPSMPLLPWIPNGPAYFFTSPLTAPRNPPMFKFSPIKNPPCNRSRLSDFIGIYMFVFSEIIFVANAIRYSFRNRTFTERSIQYSHRTITGYAHHPIDFEFQLSAVRGESVEHVFIVSFVA